MAVKTIDTTQKISIEDAKESLKRSGYLLESRVETILRQAKYLVETNVLYDDPITGKKREVDLIAFTGATLTKYVDEANYKPSQALLELASGSKVFSIEALMPLDRVLGEVQVELIIECINNQQPLAFIRNEVRRNDDFIRETYGNIRASKVAGRPKNIKNPDLNRFPIELSHLASNALSNVEIQDFYTQYCSFRIKKDSKSCAEWMAYHDDIHHDSFNALCSVINQKLNEAHEFYAVHNEFRNLTLHLHIPLLIIQNDLWVVSEQPNGEMEIEEVSHVNYFRASSSSINGPKGYHIDVIRESYLDQYLNDVIERSLKEIQSYCFNHVIEDDEGFKFQPIQNKKGNE